MAGPQRVAALGQYLMSIGGGKWAPVTKAEGMDFKIEKVEHKLGSDNQNILSVGNPEYTDLKFDLGIIMGADMKQWMLDTINKAYSRRNGVLDYADYNFKVIASKAFSEALIKEINLPKMEAKGKDSGKISITVAVEDVQYQPGDGKVLQGVANQGQKIWLNNAFKMDIPGWANDAVTSVDAYKIEQKVTKNWVGHMRHPTIEPSDLIYSDLTVTFQPTQDQEKSMMQLAKDIMMDGNYDASKDIAILLTYLDPSKKKELGSITFNGCFPIEVTRGGSESGKDGMTEIKVKFAVTWVDLNGLKIQ